MYLPHQVDDVGDYCQSLVSIKYVYVDCVVYVQTVKVGITWVIACFNSAISSLHQNYFAQAYVTSPIMLGLADEALKVIKGSPDPVAREVYRGLLCLRRIVQKTTDSVPQQDCEYQKVKSGCEN